jgi:hypothetical protein
MMIGYIDIDLPRGVAPVRERGPRAEVSPGAKAALRAVGSLLSGRASTASPRDKTAR